MVRFAVVAIGLFFSTVASAQSLSPQTLDVFFKKSLSEWKLPGLAVAIVDADRTLYAKGFGVREWGKPDAMTADTVFPLASCSKVLATAALGMLVDEGKLDWDEPLGKYLPWFRLRDECASKQATLRDVLCHRVGVGGHDLLWYRSNWTMEEKIKRLAFVDLDYPFRTRFEYQTVLFGISGSAAEKVSGLSWEMFLRKRVLDPIGMKNSSPMPMKDAPSVAVGHRRSKQGTIEAAAPYPFVHPDPAGSVHATARDVASFLRLQLKGGVWEGTRLLEEKTVQEIHAPQMLVRREGLAKAMSPDATMMAYCLGWVLQDSRGVRMLQHGGAIDGFRIHLMLVPEANLGVVLMNNLESTPANLAMSHALLDAWTDRPTRNWNGYYRELDEAADAAREKQLEALRRSEAAPVRPLGSYAGTYENPVYGECAVATRDEGLTLTRGAWSMPLASLGKDAFYPTAGLGQGMRIEFQFGEGDEPKLRAFDQVFRKKRAK